MMNHGFLTGFFGAIHSMAARLRSIQTHSK
jgi:hypothetical protein